MIFLKKKKPLTTLNGLCFLTKYSLILLTQFFPMRTFIRLQLMIFAISNCRCRSLFFSFVDNSSLPPMVREIEDSTQSIPSRSNISPLPFLRLYVLAYVNFTLKPGGLFLFVLKQKGSKKFKA